MKLKTIMASLVTLASAAPHYGYNWPYDGWYDGNWNTWNPPNGWTSNACQDAALANYNAIVQQIQAAYQGYFGGYQNWAYQAAYAPEAYQQWQQQYTNLQSQMNTQLQNAAIALQNSYQTC